MHIDKTRNPINVMRALTRKGVHIVTHDAPQSVFTGFSGFSAKFKGLLDRARGLAFEVGKGIQLGPEGLEKVFESALGMAEQLNQDLISFRLELEGEGRVRVMPNTWSGQERARLELQGFQATTRALFEMDTVFSQQKGLTPDSAEREAAAIIFKHFKASALKAYDVAADGSIRISHQFARHGDDLVKFFRGDGGLASHFSDWVPPEEYVGEAMFEIVDGGKPFILVNDPNNDPRCRKLVEGDEVQFESKPFALIGEKNASGRITRVYKVDWETPEELLVYSELAFRGGFSRLQDIKQQLALQSEMQSIDEIHTIAATQNNVDYALELASVRIAELFEDDQSQGVLADRVTIMLNDPSSDLLSARVMWTKQAIEKSLYFVGRGDRGIARRLFDRGLTEPLYLPSIAEWKDRERGIIQWQHGGQGSLLATPLSVGDKKFGIIIVSSLTENAFTQDHVRVLGEVSRRVGPAFERMVKGMETANLHQKFGQPFDLKIYNQSYLHARLDAAIQQSRREDTPLSVIYIDIDHFKPTNEAWGSHEEVDQVLAAIFRKMLAALRDGELYLVGGEEVVVRLDASLGGAETVANRLRQAVDVPIVVKIPYMDRTLAARHMKDIKERLAAGARAAETPEAEAHKYFNSGIQAVEVVTGRDGEWLLTVTVQKTVSVGVAEYRPGDKGKELIARAETCQNQAKNEGRNRVVVQSD